MRNKKKSSSPHLEAHEYQQEKVDYDTWVNKTLRNINSSANTNDVIKEIDDSFDSL